MAKQQISLLLLGLEKVSSVCSPHLAALALHAVSLTAYIWWQKPGSIQSMGHVHDIECMPQQPWNNVVVGSIILLLQV